MMTTSLTGFLSDGAFILAEQEGLCGSVRERWFFDRKKSAKHLVLCGFAVYPSVETPW